MHRRHRECVRENVRGLREASREITVLVKLLTLDVRMRHPMPLDHLATTRDQRIRKERSCYGTGTPHRCERPGDERVLIETHESEHGQ